MMGARLGEGLLRHISVEQCALLGVHAAPVSDAHAEHLLEGGLAGLEAGDELGPRLPILLDHDLNFLGEARRRVVSERLSLRRQREGSIRQLLA